MPAMTRTLAILLVVAALLPAGAEGQGVTVEANADSGHITIGDWFRVTVSVTHPANTPVRWPVLRDSVGSFEIIRHDTLATQSDNGLVKESQRFTLTNFTGAEAFVPPFVVTYQAPGDTTVQRAASQAIRIVVASVPVDTTKAIKDIKPPLSIPLTWKDIALYAIVLLLIAAAAYGGYRYWKWRQRRAPEAVEEAAPEVPPHVRAIERLRDLEEKHLWQQGATKAFYSEATDIVREYFEGRYGITALEMTTEEIMRQLDGHIGEGGLRNDIAVLLSEADLVKFAKYAPQPDDNSSVIPRALAIVDRTKPVEQVAEHV